MLFRPERVDTGANVVNIGDQWVNVGIIPFPQTLKAGRVILMFEGEHTVTMDEKGRVNIPAGFRDALRRLYDDERVVITKDYDGCLRAYPPKEWERNVLQKVRAKSMTDPKVRAFERLVISPATTCSPDKQGRVLISQSLRTHALLSKQVIFAGGAGYFEIWDAAQREAKLQEAQALLLAGGLDL